MKIFFLAILFNKLCWSAVSFEPHQETDGKKGITKLFKTFAPNVTITHGEGTVTLSCSDEDKQEILSVLRNKNGRFKDLFPGSNPFDLRFDEQEVNSWNDFCKAVKFDDRAFNFGQFSEDSDRTLTIRGEAEDIATLVLNRFRRNNMIQWLMDDIPKFYTKTESGEHVFHYGLLNDFVRLKTIKDEALQRASHDTPPNTTLTFSTQSLVKRLIMLNGGKVMFEKVADEQYKVHVLQDREGRGNSFTLKMLIDISQSMEQSLPGVLKQSSDLLKQIRDSLKPSQSILLKIIFFNDDVYNDDGTLTQTTEDSEIDKHFSDIKASGATDLTVFLKEIIASEGETGFIVGFTDGIHCHGRPPANWPNLDTEFSKFSASTTQTKLLESFVFPVGNRCDDFLTKFAGASGGKGQKVNTTNEMFEAIKGMLPEILIGAELFRLVCDGQRVQWHVQQKPGIYTHDKTLSSTDTVQQAGFHFSPSTPNAVKPNPNQPTPPSNNVAATSTTQTPSHVSTNNTSWSFSGAIKSLGEMALPIRALTEGVGGALRAAYGLFFSSPPSN